MVGRMYKNLLFGGGDNKWKRVKWVAIFLRIGTFPPAIRLHRVTSKSSDYNFEDLSIYV